ncbi:MAG: acyl-CoA dehydrogenase family protein [Chloroflexota bacterium]|jgi:alkylation response protein AidB-like acyl-CoA dehydrogenase
MSIDAESKPIELARTLAIEIASRADEADRLGRLPAQDVALLRESGYLGLAVPLEFGGQGASLLTCVAAQMELAKGSASTALVAAMQHQVVGYQREIRSWRPDAFEQIMREAAAGGLLNSLASEPALGSPSRGGLPETTATPTDDGECLIINGHKTWSTGGSHLTHLLVRVAVGGEPGVVLVRQGTPGIEWVETWGDTLSLRASDSHDVYFHDVIVPRDNLIETGDAKARPNVWFPMMLSAVYLGTALAARDAVIQYSLERVPTALGKPIASLPKIQRQIGEIDVALQAARALLLEVASGWSGDDSERAAIMPRIAAAKTVVMDAATGATERALEVAGGSAITRALPLERYFRDVRAGQMQPPSGDTALEMVGRAALNL